jgi:hypothetical protein
MGDIIICVSSKSHISIKFGELSGDIMVSPLASPTRLKLWKREERDCMA